MGSPSAISTWPSQVASTWTLTSTIQLNIDNFVKKNQQSRQEPHFTLFHLNNQVVPVVARNYTFKLNEIK